LLFFFSQVIVNTSKAVTLIMGVFLLKEVANASASAGQTFDHVSAPAAHLSQGMCLSVIGAAMYALLP
jgi:hypothetical protein